MVACNGISKVDQASRCAKNMELAEAILNCFLSSLITAVWARIDATTPIVPKARYHCPVAVAVSGGRGRRRVVRRRRRGRRGGGSCRRCRRRRVGGGRRRGGGSGGGCRPRRGRRRPYCGCESGLLERSTGFEGVNKRNERMMIT